MRRRTQLLNVRNDTMKRIVLFTVMSLAIVLSFAGGMVFAWQDTTGKTTMHIEQIPPKAKVALMSYASGTKLKAVERSLDNGVEVYEASWVVEKSAIWAQVTADSYLTQLKEEVQEKFVPPPVIATAQKTILKTNKIRYHRRTYVMFEAEPAESTGEKPVLLTPTGKSH
jgi:hypothetical protein